MSTLNGAYIYRRNRALIDLNQAIMDDREGPKAIAWTIVFAACGHTMRTASRPSKKIRWKMCRRCGLTRPVGAVHPVYPQTVDGTSG